MSEDKPRRYGSYLHIPPDRTVPHPEPSNPDRPLSWALRYAKPTREELLVAASIVDAYAKLTLGRPCLGGGAKLLADVRRALKNEDRSLEVGASTPVGSG